MGRLPPLAAALLALACASPPPPAPAPQPARPFDADRAWEDLVALASIGPRPSASPGAARACQHIREELQALGLELRTWSPERESAAAEAGSGPGEAAGTGQVAGSKGPAEARERAGDAGAAATVEREGGAAGDASPAPRRAPVHLVGVIPGELGGLVILATRYDSPPGAGPAANGAASGPALVLELARALAAAPLPYTTWVVFLDGGADGREGVRAWAESLREEGVLPRVRLALYFQRVAAAEGPIVRDLLSRRPYREVFWEAAERWGAQEAFPPALEFAQADAAHAALFDEGLQRLVAIVGERASPPSPATDPEAAAEGQTAQDAAEEDEAGEAQAAERSPAPEGTAPGKPPASAGASLPPDTVARASREHLASVGLVALEGLDVLTRRLAKIDRLRPGPVADPAPAGGPASAEADIESP